MTRYDILDDFSLKNERLLAFFPKITFMTSRDRKFVEVAGKWHYAVHMLFTIFLSLREVSCPKTNLENVFFVKFTYVTICDLHAHHRSQVMMRNERLYMSSYL